MDRIPVFVPAMDGFVLLNVCLTLSSAVWLARLFRSRRFLFIKPSVLVLGWSHLFFQWPATVYAGYYERALPDPYAFALLLHGFVLIGLLVATHTFNSESKIQFERMVGPSTSSIWIPTCILATYCLIVTAAYLRAVPLNRTGLYVILTHPVLAAVAREDSLKLITNTTLRYAYQVLASAVAPLLAANLAIIGWRFARDRKLGSTVLLATGLALLIVAASLPGNRGTAAKLLLVVAATRFLAGGMPVRPVTVSITATVVLAPAVVLTLLREGKGISGGLFLSYLTDALFNRVFVVPIQVAAFHVHYAQTHGAFGIAGISRLASLLGLTPVHSAQLIGRLYTASSVESVSANAGFLFTYYGYFGMLSLPISLLCLWSLDLAVPIFRRLTSRLLLPAVAATSVATLAFISSEFTTVLLTHGFAVIVLLSLTLSWFLVSSGQSLAETAPLRSGPRAAPL